MIVVVVALNFLFLSLRQDDLHDQGDDRSNNMLGEFITRVSGFVNYRIFAIDLSTIKCYKLSRFIETGRDKGLNRTPWWASTPETIQFILRNELYLWNT